MDQSQPSAAVLVSAGRNPLTGTSRACRGDAVAMALGRKLAGDALRVLHCGSPEEPALVDYLAYGAGTIEIMSPGDAPDVASALATAVQPADLILTGCRSEAGAGSGMLPYHLARILNRPVIANVLEARLERDCVRIRQFLPKGKRRGIEAPLPAILAVHPLAPAELRYAYARRVSGRIVTLPSEQKQQSENSAVPPNWHVIPADRQPRRLKAEGNLAGHERLMAAIAMESRSGVVVTQGSITDKAQAVLDYLRSNKLIDL